MPEIQGKRLTKNDNSIVLEGTCAAPTLYKKCTKMLGLLHLPDMT